MTTTLPSFGLDPDREVTHPSQQGITDAVLEFCHDGLAALEQYSALLLDGRDIRSVPAEERAALITLQARVKQTCPHRCQSFADIHAKTVVYRELAEWFPLHDIGVYASDLIGEVSAFLERQHLDSGLAARVGRTMPPHKGGVTR